MLMKLLTTPISNARASTINQRLKIVNVNKQSSLPEGVEEPVEALLDEAQRAPGGVRLHLYLAAHVGRAGIEPNLDAQQQRARSVPTEKSRCCARRPMHSLSFAAAAARLRRAAAATLAAGSAHTALCTLQWAFCASRVSYHTPLQRAHCLAPVTSTRLWAHTRTDGGGRGGTGFAPSLDMLFAARIFHSDALRR